MAKLILGLNFTWETNVLHLGSSSGAEPHGEFESHPVAIALKLWGKLVTPPRA